MHLYVQRQIHTYTHVQSASFSSDGWKEVSVCGEILNEIMLRPEAQFFLAPIDLEKDEVQFMYVCMYVCMYKYMAVCHTCMYVFFVCICMYLCVNVCVCVCIYIYIYIYMGIWHTCMHMYVCIIQI